MDFLEIQPLKHLYLADHQFDDNKVFDFHFSPFLSHPFYHLDPDNAENRKIENELKSSITPTTATPYQNLKHTL